MMGKLTGLCVLLAVLNVAVTEDTVTPVYFTDGGDLTLEVRPAFPGHMNHIVWIFNGTLLLEWVEDVAYRIKGRATLIIETGQLIINKMSKEDEGVYSVEINNRFQSERYQATLIKKVQKPKVVMRTFTFESKSCKFSCDSDTTGAEPVSYSWKKGDGEWEVSGRYINITSKDDSGVKNLTCRMENPVSREESDPEPNPLYKEPSVVGPAVGGLFGALGGLGGCVGVGLLVAWIMKIDHFNEGSISITNPANGNAQPTSHPSDSATNPAEDIPLQANPENPKSDAIEAACS